MLRDLWMLNLCQYQTALEHPTSETNFLNHSASLIYISQSSTQSHFLGHAWPPFLSASPLSPSITPSLFHSRLKTHLFHKSFPPCSLPIIDHPWTDFTVTRTAHWFYLAKRGRLSRHWSAFERAPYIFFSWIFIHSLKVLEDVAEEEDNVNEMDAAAAAAEETVMQAMSEEDFKRESQLLTKLTAQQIRLILEDVCTEMLSGIEVLVIKYATAVAVWRSL